MHCQLKRRLAAVLCLSIVVLQSGCTRRSATDQQPAAVQVVVATPIKKSIVEWDEYVGRFEAVDLVPERTVINLPSAAIVWTGQVVTKDGRSFPTQGIEVLDFTEEGQIALRRAFVG